MSGGAENAIVDAPESTLVSDGTYLGAVIAACPFCGERMSFLVIEGIAVDDDGAELSAVSCNQCGASGPMVEHGCEAAVAAWCAREVGHVH